MRTSVSLSVIDLLWQQYQPTKYQDIVHDQEDPKALQTQTSPGCLSTSCVQCGGVLFTEESRFISSSKMVRFVSTDVLKSASLKLTSDVTNLVAATSWCVVISLPIT